MPQQSQTETWVKTARQGDKLALAKLLTAYHPRLRSWAETRMDAAIKARISPDDILQEVYLETARQIAQFEDRGPGSFLSWVHSILNHKLIDTLRAVHCQVRDIHREVPAAVAAADSYWDLLDDLHTESGTTSRAVRRQEALGALLASLSDLSEPRRQVIQLRFLEGLPVAEVAGRIGKSEDAVVALTRRALDDLRRSMDRMGEFTRAG